MKLKFEESWSIEAATKMLNPSLFLDVLLMLAAGIVLQTQPKLPPPRTWKRAAYIVSCFIAFTSIIGIGTMVVVSWMCPHFLAEKAYLSRPPRFVLPDTLLEPYVPLLSETLIGIALTVRWSLLAGIIFVIGYSAKTRVVKVMGMGM